MFAKGLIANGKRILRFLTVLLAFTSFAAVPARTTFADASPPNEIDARYVIEQLSNVLEKASRDTEEHLSRLGFAAQINEIHTVDGVQLHAFSPDTIIESLYRRAETQAVGEGNRFLAVLYSDAAKRFASVTVEPDFAVLRKFSPEDLKRPFKFASLAAISNINTRPPLSAIAGKAVDKLAEFYSGGRLAQARLVLLRHLRKEGFNSRKFEQALAETKTTKDALRRLVVYGTPPPPVEIALRDMMRESMAGSAALSVDRSALDIMEELSKQLPPEIEQYIKAEDSLESRKRQFAEAAIIKQSGKISPRENEAVIARIDDLLRTNPPVPYPVGVEAEVVVLEAEVVVLEEGGIRIPVQIRGSRARQVLRGLAIPT